MSTTTDMLEPSSAARAPSARASVALELSRAALDAGLLPLRAAGYLARRARLEREARGDLEHPAARVREPALPPRAAFPDRPLRVFVSCAEVSGELHAAKAVDALRAACAERGAPEPRFVGLGGAGLAARGVELAGDPVARAAMGLDAVAALPFYVRLLRDAATRLVGCDLCLPVDSPALHVPLARLARARGVPVAHFVTPQYWGWAPWRVDAYRRAVDLALCILPFEVPWFERHGVQSAFVGHPLLDELAGVRSAGGGDPRSPVLALLPGSRRGVLERNLPWMLRALARLRARHPEARGVVPTPRPELAERARELVAAAGAGAHVEVREGELHDALRGARAALSVSGTVLLDLLHHRLPAVVIYRVAGAREEWLSRRFLTTPWFSSVNLLAGREVYPEACFAGDGPVGRLDGELARAWADPAARAACRAGLDAAAERLGPPGAARRAARCALAVALHAPL